MNVLKLDDGTCAAAEMKATFGNGSSRIASTPGRGCG